jgi:transcriptional repressor NrdR
MRCPYCGSDSHVVDTRGVSEAIRRRRECDRCGQRFTTYERISGTNLQVVKADGRRQDFDRDKLLRGMRLACVKRPVSTDALERLVADIESKLYQLGKSEVSSAIVGEMVMERLRQLDDVAYVRFASVYRRFTDLEVLSEEIDRLRAAKQREEELRQQLRLGL